MFKSEIKIILDMAILTKAQYTSMPCDNLEVGLRMYQMFQRLQVNIRVNV